MRSYITPSPRGIAPKTPQARAATTALVRVGIAERQRFLPNPKIKKTLG